MGDIGEQLKQVRGALSQVEAARRAGISQQMWSKLETGAAAPDDSVSLYKIAAAFGWTVRKLPHDPTDEDGPGLELVPASRVSEDPAHYAVGSPVQLGPDITSMRSTPIVGQAKLGEDGFFVEEDYPSGHGDGFIDHPTKDPNAYSLRVVGESMSPAIRHGWFVACEPNSPCRVSEFVHVMTKAGQHMVKELLYDRAGEVTLLSINGSHRLTLRKDELEYMHYVGGIYPPSKRRL